MTKTAAQTRAAFLDFFRSKDHAVVSSASLIPGNDPTLMFTNAGMVQFKDVFTGKELRPYRRATSSQKCIRISGKHNDLENVGVTARHHTFFEMLGNFSFGDYFKEEAIAYAWELLTKVYELPESRLVITVFGGDASQGLAPDTEARSLWKRVTGFDDSRIIDMGMKDNFWQMGDTGPCGPCTEIHFCAGDSVDYSKFGEEPGPDGKGWIEIWNLVFMQYERSLREGAFHLEPLPKPCVDTGAGLERVASVLQGKTSNYDSDLLRALVEKAGAIAGKPYTAGAGDDDVSMRVLADHARTTAFLIAEGVFPDRAARPYVLRRVMRRAIRHGHRLGIARPFLHELAKEVTLLMGEQYPELVERRELILSVTEQEEVRFRETMDRGLRILDEELAAVKKSGTTTLSGPVAFKLYDTYGFPVDLTEVIVAERGLLVDLPGYEAAMEEARKRSEGSKVGEAAVASVWRDLSDAVGKKCPDGIRFIGYEREEGEGTVVALAVGAELVEAAAAGQDAFVVTDLTPFYGESGGQVGDVGRILGDGVALRVTDTQKPHGGVFVHHAHVEEGTLRVGDRVRLVVDHGARTATRRNHSATHLLHYALRRVLGEQATQKGSLVGPDRLRFDFSHGRAVSPDELSEIEDLVNQKILENAPVETEILPLEQARARGAMAMFGEKYGDVVRVLTMTQDSVEFCGGTHARALGEIGLFKILSESAVAAGVRRIEATTGLGALAYVRNVEHSLRGVSRLTKCAPAEVVERVEKVLERERALEKEVAELRKKIALGSVGGPSAGGASMDPLALARPIEGGKALSVTLQGADAKTLREAAEGYRDKLGESVVLVASIDAAKVSLVVAVSKGLTSRLKAGELIRPIAAVVGGSGGGRPDMAQAGGADVDKLHDAVTKFFELVGAT